MATMDKGVFLLLLLAGSLALGIYQLVRISDSCVGLSYPLVPCFCVTALGFANALMPCAVITYHQTGCILFSVTVAKCLAYVLATQFADTFGLGDTPTRLMFMDAGYLLFIITVAIVNHSCEREPLHLDGVAFTALDGVTVEHEPMEPIQAAPAA